MYNPSQDIKDIQELLKAGIKSGLPDKRIKMNVFLVRIINVALFSTLLCTIYYLLK